MATRATLLGGAGAALGLGLLYLWMAPRPPAPPEAARAEPNHFAFVKSMEGTRPDGDIKLNPADQLVVDAELGYLFDYYLAGLGERDLAEIRAEIERELDRRLKPGAAVAAKRLLSSYLEYKRALVDLERTVKAGKDIVQAARARREAVMELRKRYFSPQEIAGLFGATDAYDADALARMEVTQDKKLSEAERKEKLARLDAKLTPAQRAERDAPVALMKLEDTVRQARAKGAGDNEIYRMRAEALSPEAAARLADVDREEAQWRTRIAAYQAERKQLLGAGEPALQQLRDARFTPMEQKRLGAYE
ncbi:lipase secretion chaperone [Pseudoduganella namucuonensis]|uniref:Lipase helper protein n=1 Tax=Pseudoduganella namucuonensis TaxID=1035707 RepID=A0A1I7L561_9BURK|nr:lipase secretion chaperone [Pseudoduganella namucuonensis]SFV04840.1 Lipase chaperone LimK [Pseudoduganella namucuonensis]